jgi:hypothetical protein
MPVAHVHGRRRLGLGSRKRGDVEGPDGAGAGGHPGLLDEDRYLAPGVGGGQGLGCRSPEHRPLRRPGRSPTSSPGDG